MRDVIIGRHDQQPLQAYLYEISSGLVRFGCENQIFHATRVAGVVLNVGCEEPSQTIEQQPSLGGSVGFVDSMYQREIGGPKSGLIQDASQQFAVSDQHQVLLVHFTKGRRWHFGLAVEGKPTLVEHVGIVVSLVVVLSTWAVAQMQQERCDDLLARPQRFRLENGWRHQLDILVRFEDLQTRQAGQGGEQKLLVLPSFQEGVSHGQLDASTDVILDQSSKWRSIRGDNVLQIGLGDMHGFRSGNIGLRKVTVHFVTIVIGIVRVAVFRSSALVTIRKRSLRSFDTDFDLLA